MPNSQIPHKNAGNTDARGDASNTDASGDASNTDASGDASNTDASGDASNTDARGDAGNTDARGDAGNSDASPQIVPPAPFELTAPLNISLTQMRYLLATTETTTWKQAARRLGVTGPALSQGLAELERRLGIPLFNSDGRHRVLNPNGHTIVDHARRIVAEYAEMSRFARSVRDGTGGRLRIGMIDTAALHHFADVLIGFKESHPDVDFHLVVQPSSTLLDLLDRGRLDVIVGVDLPTDDRYHTTTLLDEPLFIYAPAGTPPTLARHLWGPWVTFPATSRTRRRIAQHVAGRGANFEVVAESSQPSVLRGMVHLALGWTVLCRTDAEHAPYALEPFDRRPLTKRSLILSYRADRRLNEAGDSLIESLIS